MGRRPDHSASKRPCGTQTTVPQDRLSMRVAGHPGTGEFATRRNAIGRPQAADWQDRSNRLGRGQPFTRLRYSAVRVSISILSPISQNSGTGSSKPVLILAVFMTLPEVSPLMAGSV